MDYFELLGLPRQPVVDLKQLQANYYDRTRLHHPDRHASDGHAVRESATLATAALNQGYRTLREPLARARYWLEREGEALRDNENRVPAALTALYFETQEIIEENQGPPVAPDPLQSQRATLTAKRAELMTALEANFAKWSATSSPRATLRTELREIVLQLSYLDKLIADVERALARRRAEPEVGV